MEYVNFNDVLLPASRIGFGCCPMGQYGWGSTEEGALIEAARFALDSGVTLFDTADVYGLGASEVTLGRALSGRRDKALIATKFGVRRDGSVTRYDNSPRYICRALDASLKRLATDYVDIYFLHYWDGVTPMEAIFEQLSTLRSGGKIRAFGVTNTDLVAHGIEVERSGLVACSYEYSLANRTKEPQIIKNVETLKVRFLSWGSLGQGVLTGKYGRNTQFPSDDRRCRPAYVNFHGDRLERNLRIVNRIMSLQPHYPTRSPSQIALRWILDRIPGSIALVGVKRKEQVADNLGAADWSLSQEDFTRLGMASGGMLTGVTNEVCL